MRLQASCMRLAVRLRGKTSMEKKWRFEREECANYGQSRWLKETDI